VSTNRLVEMDAFVRVVKNQNFVAAASELGVSPALITRRVQHLEADLGTRLISRTTRRLGLTEAGKRYFTFCVRMLKELQEEENAIKQLQQEPVGRLNVLATMSFGIMEMGKAVTSFMMKYPQIQITLIIGDIGRRPLDPSEYGADVAIGFSQPKESGMHLQKLGKMAWTLCASPSYLRKAGTPKTPADLTQHSCLVTARPFADGIWEFNGPSGIQSISVSGVVSPSSAITMRYMALDGVGVALLPDFCVAEDIRKRRLVRVLAGFRAPEQSICAYYPHGRQQTVKMGLFLEFLEFRFTKAAWGSGP
jgi:DNA-binding transcriptional LysR family regulator